MAYPMRCYAGFNIPSKQGRFLLLGFSVPVEDPSADSEFALVDDEDIKDWMTGGFVLGSLSETKKVLADIKGSGSAYTSMLEFYPPEPVQVTYGTSVYCTNVRQEGICVYVR